MLDRKLARELYRSKGLLLAITSIIAVGVMCFVAMQSSYQNLRTAKQRYYRQCRMADFWIDVKKVPLSELEDVARLPGVTELQPRIQFSAVVDLENVVEPLNGFVISLPDKSGTVINDIVLQKGDYFTTRRNNEVIVNDSFAREHGIFPGSWIHLLLNNRRQELFVVGTAISSEFTYLIAPGSIVPDPEKFGVFYIKQSYAEEVFDFEGAANQLVGRLSPSVRDNPDEVLQRAETLLEPYGVFSATPLKRQTSNQFLSAEIEGLGAFATVVPTIFLAVAALVLNVLITRLARQQRVVVGTLKALGYTDWRIFAHFVKFGLSVGIVGGVAGGLLGFLLSAWMTSIYATFFEFPDLRSGVYLYTHTIGMTVSLVCALVGSLYGARSVLKLQPAEAMRPERPRRGGRIWLERFGAFWKLLTAPWRVALRSIFRNRFRTATGVFAATMGAGLLVTGFMLGESQNYFIDFQFHRIMRSDIDLAFKNEEGIDALREVQSLPGVDYAEPTLNVACTFSSGPYRRKAGITGILSDARLTIPHDAEGRRLTLPDTGIIMSRDLADILHVSIGDEVTITPVNGERRPVKVKVVKIADSYMGMTVYARLEYLSRLIGEEFAINGAQLMTDGNPQHLRQLHYQLKRTPGVLSINARRDMADKITEVLLENQSISIGVLVFFAGTIFFGSIVNASIVNLAERQREVATLRALGYGELRIGAMFFRESLLTNTIGTLLGLPVGYLLTVLTAASYDNEILRLPVVSAPWIWIATILLSIAFALLAHGVVQYSIHRMNCLEALNAKE